MSGRARVLAFLCTVLLAGASSPAPVRAAEPAALAADLPASAAASAPDAPAVVTPATTPPTGTRTVVVEAPSALRDLLVGNLDLTRAARLTGESALDTSEWARLVAAAPAQARDLLATEGYFDATVTVTVSRDAGRGAGFRGRVGELGDVDGNGDDGAEAGASADDARTIRVRVQPGPQTRVQEVTLQFDGDLDRAATTGDATARAVEADLRRAWSLPEGSPFRNKAWSDAKAQWLALMRSRGYGAASWSGTAATVVPARHQVALFLVADSGPLFRAGNLLIEGLERQPEATVRNLAGFPSGTPLEESRLLDYQDRLQKTGLYDQVAVTYDPDPSQAGHATVTVHLHEQKIHQATIALGVTSNAALAHRLEPRISLEYVDRLPFGRPLTLDAKLVWGTEDRSLNLDVATQPGPDFHSWVAGLLVDRLVTTVDVTETQRVRAGRTRDTAQFDRLQFLQVERTQDCVLTFDCVDARAVSVNQNTIWRRLDNLILPTDGWSLNVQAEAGVAGGPKSDYGPFARLYGRYTAYQPLPDHFYATGRVEVGQVVVGKVTVPDPELFRAGGDDSVRGYPSRTLAPTTRYATSATDTVAVVIGGKSLLTLSAEIAHPVAASLPSVWWAAFVDAGNAVDRFSDMNLAVSPGVGVRWRSPIGPLRIDFAWGERIHQGRLSLSLGTTF